MKKHKTTVPHGGVADPHDYYLAVRTDKFGVPRLDSDDYREVAVGKTLKMEKPIALNSNGVGLYVWNSLIYSMMGIGKKNNTCLCRVRLSGEVIRYEWESRSVATEWTITGMLLPDTTQQFMMDFGRWCALQVIDLWDAPEVVKLFLESGDLTFRGNAFGAVNDLLDESRSTVAEAAFNAALALMHGPIDEPWHHDSSYYMTMWNTLAASSLGLAKGQNIVVSTIKDAFRSLNLTQLSSAIRSTIYDAAAALDDDLIQREAKKIAEVSTDYALRQIMWEIAERHLVQMFNDTLSSPSMKPTVHLANENA